MDADSQRRFMFLALMEGRKALPGCIPNPPVGCVLVRRGAVVAAGYTNPPGQWHAEAMALSQLAGPLADVTVFVIDPDPRNNGAGVQMLRRAGIEVSIGLLEDRAQEELGPYLSRPGNLMFKTS